MNLFQSFQASKALFRAPAVIAKRSQIQKSSILLPSSHFSFSSYLSQMQNRFKQIDAVHSTSAATPDEFRVSIPFESANIEINLKLDNTVGELTETLKKANEHIKKAIFYTLDGAKIPNCEILSHRNNLPMILSINDSYSYSVNLNPNYSIVHNFEDNNRQSEEAYLHYCQGIGLPQYNSFLLANFTNKLHHTLPEKATVNKDEIIKGLYQTMGYFRSISHEQNLMKVSDLERVMEQKKSELVDLYSTKAILDKKADFRA